MKVNYLVHSKSLYKRVVRTLYKLDIITLDKTINNAVKLKEEERKKMLKEYLNIREIKNEKEIEDYLKRHEKKYEDTYFVFEDKYTKNAYLYVASGNESYSFSFNSSLGVYVECLYALDAHTKEEIAKELFKIIQEEY